MTIVPIRSAIVRFVNFVPKKVRFCCWITEPFILRWLKIIQIGIAALMITVSNWEDVFMPATIMKSAKLIV